MVCRYQQDYPYRMVVAKGGVVHAACIEYRRGHTTYTYKAKGEKGFRKEIPPRDVYTRACKWEDIGLAEGEEMLVASSTEITCKQCLKAMGIVEARASAERYAVMEAESGKFFKKSARWCKDPWVSDILNATLYQMRSAAERVAGSSGKRVVKTVKLIVE